jgi:hypothetical protein
VLPYKKLINPRGQGLLEFAVVLPFLLILMAAIADLGMMYLTAQTVKHASREGARYAVKLENLQVASAGQPGDPRVNEYIELHIPAENLYASFTTVSTTFLGCATNEQVTVTISGTYNWLALGMIGLPPLNLNLDTSMRYELCGDEGI